MTSVITLWRWVADLTDQKLIGMVDRKLSHDEMLVISSNEAINAHVAWPNGQKAIFWSNLPLKWLQWPPGDLRWVISSIKNSLVWSVEKCLNIRRRSAVQMKGLKTIQDD